MPANRYVKMWSLSHSPGPHIYYYEIDPRGDVPRLIWLFPDGYIQWDAVAAHECPDSMFGHNSCIEGPWKDFPLANPDIDTEGIAGEDIDSDLFEEVWTQAVRTGQGPYNPENWRTD